MMGNNTVTLNQADTSRFTYKEIQWNKKRQINTVVSGHSNISPVASSTDLNHVLHFQDAAV